MCACTVCVDGGGGGGELLDTTHKMFPFAISVLSHSSIIIFYLPEKSCELLCSDELWCHVSFAAIIMLGFFPQYCSVRLKSLKVLWIMSIKLLN